MKQFVVPTVTNDEDNIDLAIYNQKLTSFSFWKNESKEIKIPPQNVVACHSFRDLFAIKVNNGDLLFNYNNKWLNVKIKVNGNINCLEWEHFSDRLIVGTNSGLYFSIV